MTASPVVTPTPGTTPIATPDATGASGIKSSAPATGQVPAGITPALQATTAPQTTVPSLRTGPQFTLPGHPFGATAGDARPY